jgi:tetratricopeptide (TPR) repeat protein
MRPVLLITTCLATLYLPALSAQPDNQQDKAESSARASEESSSKDTRVDLSPPKDDEKNHPMSGAAVSDAKDAASDVEELHPWDPHKAAKDVEVGDFYFKKKNYRAAIERYKEALVYKPNDAIANLRLGECLEKTGNPQEAVSHYQEYLKILPHGPLSQDAQKALERLKGSGVKEDTASK